MHRTVFRTALLVTLVATAAPAWAQRDSPDPRRDAPQRETRRPSSTDFATTEYRKGTDATQVAGKLRSDYRERTDRLGPVLMSAGYDGPQVMEALLAEGVSLSQAIGQIGRRGDGPPSVGAAPESWQMARTLAQGGHPADEAANVLVEVYDVDATEAAEALEFAGYPVAAVARALRVEFGVDDAAAIVALRGAGYSCEDAWSGVVTRSSGFRGSGTDRVAGLYEAGCSRDVVRGILENNFTPRVLAGWLAGLLEP